METTAFNGMLKNAPSSESAVGLNFLIADASGNLKKAPSSTASIVKLNSKEEPGTVLELKDFSLRYLKDVPPGTLVVDTMNSTAKSYSLKLREGLVVNLQTYMILVTKNQGYLDSVYGYCYLSFLMVPAIGASYMYHVYQYTGKTPDDYTCVIKRLSFETI